MAAFTSVQTGDWNDGATWGKTSPGDKGTDWPGLAGDTATIGTGHVVTYNVSETNELGDVTVNGTLIASRSMSTKITLGNTSLSIGATGVFDFGTEVSPIPVPYTCDIVFNTTGDNLQGFACADGGAYSICGESNYCSVWESTLANDAENTDDDDTIMLNDDLSADWHVGDEITIQREWMGDASSHTDAIIKCTIVSFSGASITLNTTVTGMVTGVGDAWVSTVTNVSRNVRVSKLNAVTDIQSSSRYNTNRPRFVDSTTGTNSNYIKNAQVTGFYAITVNGGTLTNCVVRNGERGLADSDFNAISYCYIYGNNHQLYYCENCTVSYCSLYAGLSALNNDKCTYDHCHIYCLSYAGYVNYSTLTNCSIHTSQYFSSYGVGVIAINCQIYANNVVLDSAGSCSIDQCNIYDNTYCLNGCRYLPIKVTKSYFYNNNGVINLGTGTSFYDCSFGYDSLDVSYPNTTEIRGNCINILLSNCKLPLTGLKFYEMNSPGGMLLYEVLCEHHDKVLNSMKIYYNKGEIVKTPCDETGTSPSVDPDGGNSDCIEISNLQSNLSAYDCLKAFLFNRYQILATASVEKTYTFKIQSTFTATLANTEVVLEATYLSSATDGATTVVTSTQTVAARSSAADWTQVLSVTITPAQTGFIDFQIRLCKYESGKKLYIWPEVAIT